MYNVSFKIEGGEDVTIFAVGGENILELARKSDVSIDAPCSGNGTCGKCNVKIEQGDGSSVWHLACQTTISGDTVIHVPNTASEYINKITTEVYTEQGDGSSVCSQTENQTDEPSPCSPCSEYGLAIDVGTTTVSALLVDLATEDKIAKATTGNGQIRYGADVINRIIQQQKPDGIQKLQDAIVKDTLIPLIDNLCTTTGVPNDKITRLTVAANTTMNHLLLGVDANSIRIEPYEPAFLEFGVYDPASIGISVSPDAKMYLAPNIGSYVGGDITAGVMVAVPPSGWPMWTHPDIEMTQGITDANGELAFEKFEQPKEMNLLIDLGTNGEIVFGDGEFLMACACSAGPAFEGGDISCGMRATDGAIEACRIKQGDGSSVLFSEPELSIIGGGKPAGLCGSGLIDVVAELFRNGIINGKGKLNASPVNNRIHHDEYGTGSYTLAFAADTATGRDITITEVDLDNFIRAKGAIFSGIMSLLEPLGITTADIDNVMIAGGIGSGINIKNAISIGMLPDLPEEKYSYIGNSSLNGAYAMLVVPEGDEVVIDVARSMTYIDLSTTPGYMDEFVAACFLPHTDETLFPSLI